MSDYMLVPTGGVSAPQLATLLSLQGLVNRQGPRIFFLPRPDGSEAHWVEWYRRYGLNPVETSAAEAVEAHAAQAKGYIVYDPDVPDTLNAAMVLAGVRDAVVCAPQDADGFKARGMTCIEDLQGRWSDKIEVYRWLIDEVMAQCDCRILANYDQKDTANIRPTMDYLVGHRGFCMGVCINAADYPDEAVLWDEVQTAAPDHAMMLGWHTSRDTEATHVYFGSQHNVWVYCAGAWNMSFHQHVAAKKSYAQPHAAATECDPAARYVTITLSDGDSWHSMVDVQKKFWRHPRRGEAPLGWEVAPVFAEVGPAVLEYYYETRTDQDYLVCGPSGIGYNYLSGFADWQGFLERSAKAMDATSLRTIWAINRVVRHQPGGAIEHRLKNGPITYTKADMEAFGGIKDQNGADWVDPEMVARYMDGIPEALGFFQGWESIPGEGPRWVDGKPWCPTAVLVRHDVDAVIAEFEQEAERQPVPAFLAGHVNCYDADMDSVLAVVHGLEEKGYRVVRPDEFLQLARDAHHRGLRGNDE
ncbi:MAG: hypothetical protein GY851_24240 [bacterium]|nr:hypothetical protein [bacterium]